MWATEGLPFGIDRNSSGLIKILEFNPILEETEIVVSIQNQVTGKGIPMTPMTLPDWFVRGDFDMQIQRF